MAAMIDAGAEAVLVLGSSVTFNNRIRLAALALGHHLPSISGRQDAVLGVQIANRTFQRRERAQQSAMSSTTWIIHTGNNTALAGPRLQPNRKLTIRPSFSEMFVACLVAPSQRRHCKDRNRRLSRIC